jgi:hypothetical protein
MDFSGEKDQPEGGGLVIDYTPKGNLEVRRITLAFTETGAKRAVITGNSGSPTHLNVVC